MSLHSLHSLAQWLSDEEQRNSHTALSWIFNFVDIIYVGVISSIGQVFEQCGNNHKVFLMAASYLGIMFTTRYQFDQYASTFCTTKTENSREVLRIILMLFYLVAIYSMALNIAFDEVEADSTDVGHFGTCAQNSAYAMIFAISFLFSRIAIIILYWTKFRDERYSSNPDFTILFRRKFVPTICGCIVMLTTFVGVSPLLVFNIVAFCELWGEFFGEAMVRVSSGGLALMPDPEYLQERLGLFFMLVLGETMVGTLFDFYNTQKLKRSYGTNMAACILVIAIGMQFFERAQSSVDSPTNEYGDVYDENEDVVRHTGIDRISTAAFNDPMKHLQALHIGGAKDELSHSTDVESNKWNHHPLMHKNKFYYSVYVALHFVISYSMLVATTAYVEISRGVQGYSDDTEFDNSYVQLKQQVVTGLIGVWVTMIALELLQPEYYYLLIADWQTSKLVDQKYAKMVFLSKICVIVGHALTLLQSNVPTKGNYFVFYNALIATFPCMLDIAKTTYDVVGDTEKKRLGELKRALDEKLGKTKN